MVSDLTLSFRVILAVLLKNFISATAILFLSDFISAQVSLLYVIIGTASVLYTFSLLSFCTVLLLRLLLISPVTEKFCYLCLLLPETKFYFQGIKTCWPVRWCFLLLQCSSSPCPSFWKPQFWFCLKISSYRCSIVFFISNWVRFKFQFWPNFLGWINFEFWSQGWVVLTYSQLGVGISTRNDGYNPIIRILTGSLAVHVYTCTHGHKLIKITTYYGDT